MTDFFTRRQVLWGGAASALALAVSSQAVADDFDLIDQLGADIISRAGAILFSDEAVRARIANGETPAQSWTAQRVEQALTKALVGMQDSAEVQLLLQSYRAGDLGNYNKFTGRGHTSQSGPRSIAKMFRDADTIIRLIDDNPGISSETVRNRQTFDRVYDRGLQQFLTMVADDPTQYRGAYESSRDFMRAAWDEGFGQFVEGNLTAFLEGAPLPIAPRGDRDPLGFGTRLP